MRTDRNAEDISICLGNLLDNAIEAVKELTEDRVIRLWITTDGSLVAVHPLLSGGGNIRIESLLFLLRRPLLLRRRINQP